MKARWLLFPISIGALVYLAYIIFINPENKLPQGYPLQVSVDVLPIKMTSPSLYEILPGRTVAYEDAEIRPQVSGIIIKRLFEEGSQVSKGDQLYQIDPAIYEAELAKAEADLSKAQSNFNTINTKLKRYVSLLDKKAVSDQVYEDVLLELEQAKDEIAISQALVQKANINANYTKVYAPISGHIGKSSVTKGDLVTASQPQALAKITCLNPIYVDLTLSSHEFMRLRSEAKIKDHLKVSLFLNGRDNEYSEMGKLQFSDVTVDETTSSVLLRAIFPNPEDFLLPGLFVRAKIHLGASDAFLVPQKVVMRHNDGNTYVWKLDANNKVTLQNIVVGQAYDNQWKVNEGLKEGDTILLNGFQKISPGMEVLPSNPAEDSKKQ